MSAITRTPEEFKSFRSSVPAVADYERQVDKTASLERGKVNELVEKIERERAATLRGTQKGIRDCTPTFSSSRGRDNQAREGSSTPTVVRLSIIRQSG